MGYFDKFQAQNTKLENILDENGLLHKFYTDRYPMQLVILQDLSLDAQMTRMEESEDGISSRDAKLVLTFPVGEIGVRVTGRLILSESLLGKIKNQGKKMRDLWLQANFAALMETRGDHPTQDELDEGFAEEAAAEIENTNDFSEFYDARATEENQPGEVDTKRSDEE